MFESHSTPTYLFKLPLSSNHTQTVNSTYNTHDKTDNHSLTIIISSVVIGLAAVVGFTIACVFVWRRRQNTIRSSSGISMTIESHMSDKTNCSQDLTKKKISEETSTIKQNVNCQFSLDTTVFDSNVARHKIESKDDNSSCMADINTTSSTTPRVQQSNLYWLNDEDEEDTNSSTKRTSHHTSIHRYENLSNIQVGKGVQNDEDVKESNGAQLRTDFTEICVRKSAVSDGFEPHLVSTEGYTTLGESLKNFQNIYNDSSVFEFSASADTHIYVNYKTEQSTGPYNNVIGTRKMENPTSYDNLDICDKTEHQATFNDMVETMEITETQDPIYNNVSANANTRRSHGEVVVYTSETELVYSPF